MPTVYRRGVLAGDETIHAARASLAGLTAMCGAGRIAQELPGRFDPAEHGACAQCIAIIAT